MNEPDISRVAEELADLYGSPRWKFWRRGFTKARAIHAIEHALLGEAAPIQLFGVAMPVGPMPDGRPPTRSDRWSIIRSQVKRQWGNR